jgi:RNA polymerase sigma-70 factor (ECF subfamily)
LAAKGYRPAKKFLAIGFAGRSCILNGRPQVPIRHGGVRFAMAGERQNPNIVLTLVAARPAEAARKTGDGEDWSRLMARAQDGDRQAYRMLLETITPHIRKMAGRCFREPSDVDDAVQDVLLTIHLVRHAYDPKRPFGPWLVAIANRRIIDRLRRDTRRKAREITFTTDHETFADPATNHRAETFDEVVLARAIDRLPPDQRQTIRMVKLNEMSLKEAAAVSGRSIVALKVATHRAVKNLRRILKQRSERP